MGVPKEAVDRQREMDGVKTPSRIPPPPPPPMMKQTQQKQTQQTQQQTGRPMIQAHELKNVKLSSSTRRVKTKEPIQTKDKDMGYFEPPSLGDIQSMLKKLKPVQ